MKNVLIGLIRKWGVKLVLREIADILRDGNDREKRLSNDLKEALDRFEK